MKILPKRKQNLTSFNKNTASNGFKEVLTNRIQVCEPLQTNEQSEQEVDKLQQGKFGETTPRSRG